MKWERVIILNKIHLIIDFVKTKTVIVNSTVKWEVVTLFPFQIFVPNVYEISS